METYTRRRKYNTHYQPTGRGDSSTFDRSKRTSFRDETPLHWASGDGNIETVRAILQVEEAKPSLYVLDAENQIPLDLAVHNGDKEIATPLLELEMP